MKRRVSCGEGSRLFAVKGVFVVVMQPCKGITDKKNTHTLSAGVILLCASVHIIGIVYLKGDFRNNKNTLKE